MASRCSAAGRSGEPNRAGMLRQASAGSGRGERESPSISLRTALRSSFDNLLCLLSFSPSAILDEGISDRWQGVLRREV